jgi:hypothetical protein
MNVHEYLGVPKSWPIRENIKHSIILMPTKRDIQKAKKMDPRACALHNAACRMFDIPNCAIGGRTAYIPQRNEKGNYYIARVEAPISTRKAIHKFDQTGEIPLGGFIVHPTCKTICYRAKRAYNKKWMRGEVGNPLKRRTYSKVKKRKIAVRSLPLALRVG